jgi:hypothetical protein
LEGGHSADFQGFSYNAILEFYKSSMFVVSIQSRSILVNFAEDITLAEKFTPKLFKVASGSNLTHVLYIPVVNNVQYDGNDKFVDQGKNAAFWYTSEFAANVGLKDQLKADVKAQFEYLRRKKILKNFFENADVGALNSIVI